MIGLLGGLAVAGLAGCGNPSVDIFETCTLDLQLSTDLASPGEVVSVEGGPLTEPYDTVVVVGGVQAEVVSIGRSTDCGVCDDCLLAVDCVPCGSCPLDRFELSDRDLCFGNPLKFPPAEEEGLTGEELEAYQAGRLGVCGLCQESMTFLVPDLPAGETQVLITNRNGSSAGMFLEVLGSSPAPTGGTGAGP